MSAVSNRPPPFNSVTPPAVGDLNEDDLFRRYLPRASQGMTSVDIARLMIQCFKEGLVEGLKKCPMPREFTLNGVEYKRSWP
jgi:hypothetical protein